MSEPKYNVVSKISRGEKFVFVNANSVPLNRTAAERLMRDERSKSYVLDTRMEPVVEKDDP